MFKSYVDRKIQLVRHIAKSCRRNKIDAKTMLYAARRKQPTIMADVRIGDLVGEIRNPGSYAN